MKKTIPFGCGIVALHEDARLGLQPLEAVVAVIGPRDLGPAGVLFLHQQPLAVFAVVVMDIGRRVAVIHIGQHPGGVVGELVHLLPDSALSRRLARVGSRSRVGSIAPAQRQRVSIRRLKWMATASLT